LRSEGVPAHPDAHSGEPEPDTWTQQGFSYALHPEGRVISNSVGTYVTVLCGANPAQRSVRPHLPLRPGASTTRSGRTLRQAALHVTPAAAPSRPPKRPRIGRQCTSTSPPLRQLHGWSRPFNHLELVFSTPVDRSCEPSAQVLQATTLGLSATGRLARDAIRRQSRWAPRWYRPATANGAGIQAIRFPELTRWRTSKQQAAVDKPRCGPSQASRPDRQYETVRQAATVRSGVPEQRPLSAADRSHGET